MMDGSMAARPFVHLHCHSHYSLLDGAASIPRLVKKAKDHGMDALALTDHGNLHGAIQFYKEALKNDLKPILGYEAYIAPGSRRDRSAGSMKESNYHLTLLAENQQGFKNLIKMASHAYLEGFYFKPRIDRELLEQYHEGIICLSGCVSSELNQVILSGGGSPKGLERACQVAGWFEQLFSDRFYLEIMNNGLDIQRQALEGVVDVSRQMGIPLVATSDAHYVNQEDAEAQDVMLCINTGRFRTDTGRLRMEGDQFFLRSQEQMYDAFPDLEEAVACSQQVADRVDITLELGKQHFPTFEIPQKHTATSYLRQLCETGLIERYAGNEEMCPGGRLATHVQERLDRELDVIHKLGFDHYFLICWDFVAEAHRQDIPATARGSGVGALVCFALYLSQPCPIKYDLLFERFLDENRRETPDIDIDFCKERRGDIIRYVKLKYGEENVAQIGTFGTLAARAAIRDVGRTLGIPLARVNQVSAMVPEDIGITLKEALARSSELNQVYKQDGEIRELIDLAMKIEGLARNVATHAAAVVIADRPIPEYVPLAKVTGKDDIITQWAMNDVEAAGLLKMDFLGLRNLTILRKAVEMIRQTSGDEIDLLKIPLDDTAVLDLFCRGETKGIFQFESSGIRTLLRRMKPDHFRDIIATNALYRPGPLEGGLVDDYVDVKLGVKRAIYLHPVIKEVLEETHGVMVYQEQVMLILNRLGGIELADAYTCIKAISKKSQEIIDRKKEEFLEGATSKGMQHNEANDLWVMITKFASYGFNKSHSTAYALIAYQTAYLKTHYPVEFMAALLCCDIPGRNFQRKDALVEHLEDCDRMQIEVTAPCVNSSTGGFTVQDGTIHFGLAAIKGCGESAAMAIADARQREGPFKDIFDFCERIDPAACNRATVETLIKAGAMDCLGAHRRQLIEVIERAIQAGQSAAADRRSGQQNLFAALDDDADETKQIDLPAVGEFDEREKLVLEKEVLGFFLSSHPLDEYRQLLSEYCSHTTRTIFDLQDRTEVIMGGMIGNIRLLHTRNNRPGSLTKYADFELEDVDGSIRCIAWPDRYAESAELIQPDSILLLRAVVDRRGSTDSANLVVNELIPLDKLDSLLVTGVIIRVDEQKHGAEMVSKVREITRGYPGSASLELLICLGDGTRVQLKSQSQNVSVTAELQQRLDDLLGPGNIRRITARTTKAPSGNGSSRRRGGYSPRSRS
jgi:DNA polymerase-3 subunit alpha